MKGPDLKSVLRGSGYDLGNPEDSVRVLVELKSEQPCGEWKARLAGLGLEVQQIVGKTILGSIERGRIPALKDDPDVGGVDLSVQLKPSHR